MTNTDILEEAISMAKETWNPIEFWIDFMELVNKEWLNWNPWCKVDYNGELDDECAVIVWDKKFIFNS